MKKTTGEDFYLAYHVLRISDIQNYYCRKVAMLIQHTLVGDLLLDHNLRVLMKLPLSSIVATELFMNMM